jgi:hypothetical protein
MVKYAVAVLAVLTVVAPVSAQEPACKFLCAPRLLIEPTITLEHFARAPRVAEEGVKPERETTETVFEMIFALDIPTAMPRLGLTLEAIFHPFTKTGENPFTGGTSDEVGGEIRENAVEIESELNLFWLESEQTGGWVSSHFDIVDQFSPSQRPNDRGVYTHKLDFELDTAVAIFKRLPETHWLHDVELETSLDYLATGLPRAGEVIKGERFFDNASPWSFSFVFVIPMIRP